MKVGLGLILLFLDAGFCALVGGLLLTGWYGFPSSPRYGLVLTILAVMFSAIFVALIDESGEGEERPPNQATGDGCEK